jgi:hypothetical protein
MIGPDGTHYALSPDLAATLQAIAVEQATTREQLRTIFQMIEGQHEQNRALNELVLSVRDLANAQKNSSEEICRMRTDVEGIKGRLPQTEEIARLRGDVDTLKGKPGRKWDAMTAAGIAAVVTGLVAWAITRVVE